MVGKTLRVPTWLLLPPAWSRRNLGKLPRYILRQMVMVFRCTFNRLMVIVALPISPTYWTIFLVIFPNLCTPLFVV